MARWIVSAAARLYRVVAIGAIVWLIHVHSARLRVEGDAPIRIEEVRAFIPAAAQLSIDESARLGQFVSDASGRRVGYVLRTSPMCDDQVGWGGPTDTLIAMDQKMRVIGIAIRTCKDTKEHLETVLEDENSGANQGPFVKSWNGKSWEEVAGFDPDRNLEGVSGASYTSKAIANSIHQRFRRPLDAQAKTNPPFRLRAGDWGVIAVIGVSLVFAFTRLRSYKWIRRGYQAALIGYLGIINGQLLAQSLFAGWAAHTVPWRLAPGLALLVAAALLVPWATRRALYCTQICPHGAAQELVGSLTRRRLHVKLPHGIDAGLRKLPFALVGLVIVFAIFTLPTHLEGHKATSDLATFEPFDAYAKAKDTGFPTRSEQIIAPQRTNLYRYLALTTVILAVAGLVAAVFVPMAYCKYGCPTGALLSFIRSHRAGGFGIRDVAAAALVALAFFLTRYYDPIHRWIVG